MKKIELEIFAAIFTFIPLLAFLTVMSKKAIVYGLIMSIFFFPYNIYQREKNAFNILFIPKEFCWLYAFIIFTPLIVTIVCFHLYTNINGAYWAFYMCIIAFTGALFELFSAKFL